MFEDFLDFSLQVVINVILQPWKDKLDKNIEKSQKVSLNEHKAPNKSIKFFLSALSGGAISNMYSVMVARYKFFPEVKTKGMAAAPRLVLFTSEHVGATLPVLFPSYPLPFTWS